MPERRPDEITWFCSSHLRHPLAKAIRKIDQGPYSHAGIRVGSEMTFEARFRCGFYDWAEYETDEYRVAEFRLRQCSQRTLKDTFDSIRLRYEGAYYPLAQMLSALPWALWRRIGVHRAVSFTRGNVCSELIWRHGYILPMNYSRAIRGAYGNPNEFTPNNLHAVCVANPSLFERLR